MKIFVACPAPAGSQRGNRVTATRWARLLRQLGHRVTIAEEWDGRPCDLMIALHAIKSQRAMAAFRAAHPDRPLILCLTGTDLYRDLKRSRAARHVLDWPDRLVVLHPQALDDLPCAVRAKTRVIHQSVATPRTLPAKSARHFDVVVLGHLRDEKDPLRAALALEHVPADCRIRLRHAGAALSPEWATRAERLILKEPRYRWLGEVPRGRAQRLLRQSHAMVISSRLEGGANVVSEAIVVGVPVLASHIAGNIGLLGADYPAYYPVGDTRALAKLMVRAASDPVFYDDLRRRIIRLQPLFRPERERAAWRELLGELATSPPACALPQPCRGW